MRMQLLGMGFGLVLGGACVVLTVLTCAACGVLSPLTVALIGFVPAGLAYSVAVSDEGNLSVAMGLLVGAGALFAVGVAV